MQKTNPQQTSMPKLIAHLSDRIRMARDIPKDIFVLLLITLVGFGGYVLGSIMTLNEAGKESLRVTKSAPSDNKLIVTPTNAGTKVGGMYVGSISGTTYHLPWCSGAQRIKEENKIWFASKGEAESHGYKPAANCKGI